MLECDLQGQGEKLKHRVLYPRVTIHPPQTLSSLIHGGEPRQASTQHGQQSRVARTQGGQQILSVGKTAAHGGQQPGVCGRSS